MSTVSFDRQIVDHMVCEIQMIRKGEIECANKMLTQRIEAMDRIWAMECLIAKDDSEYDEIISYIYEQIKEIVSKLIITV